MDRGAIGEGIAKRHSQLNDIHAGFRKSKDKLQRRIQRGIARSDVCDNAELAGISQDPKSFVDSRLQAQPNVRKFMRQQAINSAMYIR